MATFASLLLLAAVSGLALLVVKAIDQRTRDRQRVTYRLAFPADLDGDQVTAWIRAVSGTLRYGPTKLNGVPTIAFELWATSKGMTHRIKIPWTHKGYIARQLRSHVPGIKVEPEEEFPRRQWNSAVEVGLTHTSRPLYIPSAEALSTSILAAVQALKDDEAVMMQWVVTPSVPRHPPIHKEAQSHHISYKTLMNGNVANRDEVNDRRRKLEEPNVQAVLRVAAVANTPVHAAHLIDDVRKALSQARTPAVRFHKRLVTQSRIQRRIDDTKSPLIFPIQLSISELTALVGWPIGNPFVSGLPPRTSRHVPVSDAVPREGRVIGRSNMPGAERNVAVAYIDALKHMHVAGPTGSGKSVLLANMMKQDIEKGYGVILIENKGDLFHAALNYIPNERLNDVVVLDVNDTNNPVGFNILQQGNQRVVIDEIGALFDHLYKDARSVWTREVLYHGLRTLAVDPKFTFVDLAPLLVPMSHEEIEWSDGLVRSLKDRELRNFWQRFHNQPKAAQDRITQPVMDRIWQLNARPEIRNIIGQSQSSFLMSELVRDHKILLVNLAGLAKDTATLTGTLLINALWHAIKTTPSDRPTFLYLDEFQDFMDLPIDPRDMLAKARGFGLGMVLAHQHMDQLPNEMQQAVSSNARSKIIFQTSAKDAKLMAREFGGSVSEHDFMHLGAYEAVAVVATPGGVSPPFTVAALPPAPGQNLYKRVREVSRQAYGRPVAEVEAQITQRRTLEAAPKTKRPSIGSDKSWG